MTICEFDKKESKIANCLALENTAHAIAARELDGKPWQPSVSALLREAALSGAAGQWLRAGAPSHTALTMERYKWCARTGRAALQLRLPVQLAMLLAGVHDPELHRQARHVLHELALALNIRRDYELWYGKDERSIDGATPHSWLMFVAMQRASPAQRRQLERLFSSGSQIDRADLHRLYEELALPNTYQLYTHMNYRLTRTHIQQMTARLPHKIFMDILEKVYGHNQHYW